jgi:hypothetical protein
MRMITQAVVLMEEKWMKNMMKEAVNRFVEDYKTKKAKDGE